MSKKTNSLINESSPYLLQHAHNPVEWYAWNDESLKKAREENKMILVSIGYSACHWCHVMERECFEDEEVATLMNKNFINIKVDREERPDIDQVYMSAVQLMTQHGGWPLNCFTLPDGRPVFGGTYFPKERWINVLHSLKEVFEKEPEKVQAYAEQLTAGIRQHEHLVKASVETEINRDALHESVNHWKKRFDLREGGPNKAPKFPLPNNYQFLLRYCELLQTSPAPEAAVKSGTIPDHALVYEHVLLTLDKMAMGGIFDQVGGGFARYSTDHLWKAPHFEKMLYDNAQLVSLYSEAYRKTGRELYKETVYDTIGFIERELTSAEGAFYSALDADSEGEEGRFYVWEEEELKMLLGEEYKLFAEYYNINFHGAWEGKYILLRRVSDAEFCAVNNVSLKELQEKRAGWRSQLLRIRSKRVRPGLDDKILCSWNAMMVTGLCDAFTAFEDKRFLQMAKKCMKFLLQKMKNGGDGLYHSHKNGKSSINGFLEDYSFTVEALIALYQCTFDEEYPGEAVKLTEHCFRNFYDEGSGMFWFTSANDPKLIARKTALADNVIPSSNSAMARNLFYLYRLYGERKYNETALTMLRNVQPEIPAYGAGWSNWMILQLHVIQPFRELAIVGNSVEEMSARLRKPYSPNLIFAGSKGASSLPLLKDRYIEGKTLVYICTDGACELPVENAQDALKKICP